MTVALSSSSFASRRAALLGLGSSSSLWMSSLGVGGFGGGWGRGAGDEDWAWSGEAGGPTLRLKGSSRPGDDGEPLLPSSSWRERLHPREVKIGERCSEGYCSTT